MEQKTCSFCKTRLFCKKSGQAECCDISKLFYDFDVGKKCSFCKKSGQTDCCDIKKLARLADLDDKTEFRNLLHSVLPPMKDKDITPWITK